MHFLENCLEILVVLAKVSNLLFVFNIFDCQLVFLLPEKLYFLCSSLTELDLPKVLRFCRFKLLHQLLTFVL